jgi:hypothetical protein
VAAGFYHTAIFDDVNDIAIPDGTKAMSDGNSRSIPVKDQVSVPRSNTMGRTVLYSRCLVRPAQLSLTQRLMRLWRLEVTELSLR